MEKREKIRNLQVEEKRAKETFIQEYELIQEEKRRLATKQIFIPSPKEPEKSRLNGRIYGIFVEYEIFISSVGKVLGVPVEILRQSEGDNSFNQSFLRRSFFELTGFPTYWDNLQCFLDYVATYLYGKSQGYEYDSFTEYKARTLYSQIDFRLRGALEMVLRGKGVLTVDSDEYKKRMNDYRSIVLQKVDTSLTELTNPISKRDSFSFANHSEKLKKLF